MSGDNFYMQTNMVAEPGATHGPGFTTLPTTGPNPLPGIATLPGIPHGTQPSFQMRLVQSMNKDWPQHCVYDLT